MAEGCTVVYIEDDHDDHELFQYALRSLNLTPNIIHIHDGVKAMHYLQQCEAGKLPGLIITDMKLPKVSGLQLVRLIKENQLLKDIPTIVFSTSTLERDELSKLGVSFLEKPCDMNKFINELKVLFEKFSIK